MTRIVRALAFCIILSATFVCTESVSAQWGWYGGYGLYGAHQFQQMDIPYFAKYPPVYYSRPVARPYGFSPFAYLPFTETPSAPVVHRAPVAQVIINPYVKQDDTEEASVDDVQTADRRQIVYPIAEFERARLASNR